MRGKRFVRHHANADPLGNHPYQCCLIVYLQLGGDGEPQEPRLFKHKSLHGTGIIERDPSGFGFQYILEESFLYRSQRMVLRCHDDEAVLPVVRRTSSTATRAVLKATIGRKTARRKARAAL